MSLSSSQGLSFMSQLDPDVQKEAIRRHLNIESDTDDSSNSGESDFDDDYFALKPPPPIGSDSRWNDEEQDSIKLQSASKVNVSEKPKPKVSFQTGPNISYLPHSGVLPMNPLHSSVHQPRFSLLAGTPLIRHKIFNYRSSVLEQYKLTIKQKLGSEFKEEGPLQSFIVNFELLLMILLPFHLYKAFYELICKVPQLPEKIILNQPSVHRNVLENALRAIIQRSIKDENLIGLLTPEYKHKLQFVDGICHALGTLDDMFYQMWVQRLDVRTKYMEYLLSKRSLLNDVIKQGNSTEAGQHSGTKTCNKSNVKAMEPLGNNSNEESTDNQIKQELVNAEEDIMNNLLNFELESVNTIEQEQSWTETHKKSNKRALKQLPQENAFEIKNPFLVLGNNDDEDSVDDEINEEPEDAQQQLEESRKPKKKKKRKNRSRKHDCVEQKSSKKTAGKNKQEELEAKLNVIKQQITQQIQQIYEVELKKYLASSTLAKILHMKNPTVDPNWIQIRNEAADLAEVLMNFNVECCNNHLIIEVVNLLKQVYTLEEFSDADERLDQIKIEIEGLGITEPCLMKVETKAQLNSDVVQHKSNVFSMSMPLKAGDSSFLLLKKIAEASNRSCKELHFFNRTHKSDYQLSIMVEELDERKSTYEDNIFELLPIDQMEAIGVTQDSHEEVVVNNKNNNEPSGIRKSSDTPSHEFSINDNTELMPYTPKSNNTYWP